MAAQEGLMPSVGWVGQRAAGHCHLCQPWLGSKPKGWTKARKTVELAGNNNIIVEVVSVRGAGCCHRVGAGARRCRSRPAGMSRAPSVVGGSTPCRPLLSRCPYLRLVPCLSPSPCACPPSLNLSTTTLKYPSTALSTSFTVSTHHQSPYFFFYGSVARSPHPAPISFPSPEHRAPS